MSAVLPKPLLSGGSQPRVLRPRRAMPSDTVRPTRAEVSLGSVRHNLHTLRKLTRSQIWCVLKADAYGHGAKAIGRTLERAGANGICVALLEEGIELREAGITLPILVMGGYYGRAYAELIQHDLTPIVYDAQQVKALASEVQHDASGPFAVHLKVDTGMARLGVRLPELDSLLETFLECPQLRLEGLMTHFACADTSTESIDAQLSLFEQASERLAAVGIVPSVRHAANTAALLRSERAHLDLVRPGLGIFGVEPAPGLCGALRPAMRVRSEIVALRDLPRGESAGYGSTWTSARPSKLATLPMGYADGLARSSSNRGSVLIRGARAPIVGTISMDLSMVDVTDIPGVSVGDEVVVLGTQKGPLGQASITADEVAQSQGSISWEVLTNISRRVPRFYRDA